LTDLTNRQKPDFFKNRKKTALWVMARALVYSQLRKFCVPRLKDEKKRRDASK
jgi:hypothetical protein